MVKNIEHALSLVRQGVSLCAYSIKDGRKQPWDKWAGASRLSITTEDMVRNLAEKENCHGFNFLPSEAGWCIVDIDRKGGKNGLESLTVEAKRRGVFVGPTTPGYMAQTPNNGLHLYYLADDWLADFRSIGLVDGVDILCARSLAIVPGSLGITQNGDMVEYLVQGSIDNIAEMPPAMRSLFRSIHDDKERAKEESRERKIREAEERRKSRPVMEGDTLFEEASRRISARFVEEHFSAPGSYWKTGRHGQELWTLNPTRTDNHVGSFSIREDGVWFDHNGESSGDTIDLLCHKYSMKTYEAARMIITETGGNPEDYTGKPSRIVSIDLGKEAEKLQEETKESGETMCQKMKVIFGDELPTEYQAPDEIVQGILVSRSVSVLYGDSNSGKTFFALSLAGALAAGMEFHGRATEKGIVVYLAVEAPQSIKTRVQAMQRYYGVKFSDIAIVPVPLNFYSSEGDAAAVIALINEISETRGKVRLVIGDTLARMSAGANENSGEDMGPVMARFSAVAEETGASVLVIHHNGKDQARGARGWSGIRAHIDTEIEVVEADKLHTATITKQRELDSKGEAINFVLKVVEMGTGKFGNLSTTCVAIPSDHKPLTKEDKKILGDKAEIERAWDWSGRQYDTHHRRYLDRKNLVSWLVEEKGRTEGAAQQEIKPSINRLIGRLIKCGMIESYGGGWVILQNIDNSEI